MMLCACVVIKLGLNRQCEGGCRIRPERAEMNAVLEAVEPVIRVRARKGWSVGVLGGAEMRSRRRPGRFPMLMCGACPKCVTGAVAVAAYPGGHELHCVNCGLSGGTGYPEMGTARPTPERRKYSHWIEINPADFRAGPRSAVAVPSKRFGV